MLHSRSAVRWWVASGADINVVDEHGDTPLMWASFCHLVEWVEVLLRLGADACHVSNTAAGRRCTWRLTVAEGRRLCGCWLRGATLGCVTTMAALLSRSSRTALSGAGGLQRSDKSGPTTPLLPIQRLGWGCGRAKLQ